MATEKFDVTETDNEGPRSSLGKMAGGFGLFVLSFPLLFWNEGRAVETSRSLEEGAGTVTSVAADTVVPQNEGKLVHLTGEATSDQAISDDTFAVSANGLRLMRTVEMYQWEEKTKTENKKNASGKKKKTTTYTYNTVWSDELIDSAEFEITKGHLNPAELPWPNKTTNGQGITLGAFSLPENLVAKITDWQPVTPTAEAATQVSSDALVHQDYIYIGEDPTDPAVGDVRVSFRVAPHQQVSVIAKQLGSTFEPYQTEAGMPINMLTAGTVSADQMFTSALEANTTLTWILRLVGFLMMFGGIRGIFRPLTRIMEFIPLLGDLVNMGVGLFAGVLAVLLSLITISVGWIAHRPILGIGLLALGIALAVGMGLLAKTRRQRRIATA